MDRYVTYSNARRLYKVLSKKYVQDVESGDLYQPGEYPMYEALVRIGENTWSIAGIEGNLIRLSNGWTIRFTDMELAKGTKFNFNKVNEHENRLQEQAAPQRGVCKYSGSPIRSRADQARIAVQSLSYKEIHS